MMQLTQTGEGSHGIAGLIRKLGNSCLETVQRICRGTTSPHDNRNVNLAIVGRLSLGAGKSLTLVEVGNHKVLIAAGNESISTMLLLNDDVLVPPTALLR